MATLKIAEFSTVFGRQLERLLYSWYNPLHFLYFFISDSFWLKQRPYYGWLTSHFGT